jgi:hypothetical protein
VTPNAVQDFVEMIKTKLGVPAKGRKATETDAGYQLREPGNSYSCSFDAEKSDIEPENTYF